jgi:hypothetical protein
LLDDPSSRHTAERVARSAIAPWCWQPRADRLLELIKEVAAR